MKRIAKENRNHSRRAALLCCLLALTLLMSACAPASQPTSALPATAPPAAQSPARTVSVLAAGDNLIHSYIYKYAQKNAGGDGFDFLPSYKAVATAVKDADLAFLNQETILGGTELGLSGYPTFNSPTELGRDTVTLGFDVFNHATNHVLDKGEAGIRSTLDLWKNYPDVLAVGLYEDVPELNTIHTIERGGVTFAVLAYTYGTNGISLPSSSPYRVAPIDEGLILSQIREAKELADVVMVSMHWGAEDSMVVEGWQRELAQKIADAGADMIIGHHPHVLRSVEWVTRQDGSQMLCAYSLGNFISTQKVAANLLGGMLQFNVTVDKETSSHAQISGVLFTPTIAEYDAARSFVRITPLSDMTDARFSSHGARAEDRNVNATYYQMLLDKLKSAEHSAI